MGSQTIVMQDPFPCTALWYIIYHAHRPRTLEGKTRTESYGPGLHWQWHLRLQCFPYSAWPHSHSKASSALVGAQSGAYKSWGEWVGRHCKGTSRRVADADGGENAGDVVCLEWDEGRERVVWMAMCLQKTSRMIGYKQREGREMCVCNIFERMFMGMYNHQQNGETHHLGPGLSFCTYLPIRYVGLTCLSSRHYLSRLHEGVLGVVRRREANSRHRCCRGQWNVAGTSKEWVCGSWTGELGGEGRCWE